MTRTLDPEILAGFLEEARSCTPAILAGIEQLDQAADLEEAIRLADCVKGAAALVGLPGLSYVAGGLEEALDDVRRGLLPVDDGIREALRGAAGLIDTYLQGIGERAFSESTFLTMACRLFRRLRGEPEEGDEAALTAVLACLDEKTEAVDPDGEDPLAFEADVEAPARWDGESETVDPELLEVFLHEAEGHLQSIRSFLPALESGDAGAVGTIRRSAHTLKGSAAMVGFRSLTRLAHRMEDILDRIFEGRPITAETFDLLKASVDGLEDLAGGQMDAAVIHGLHARYDRLLGGEEATPEVAARKSPGEHIPAAPPLADVEVLRPAGHGAAESFVRVPLHRLDELVRLISDLTIIRTTAEQHQSANSQKIEELRRITERLRSDLAPGTPCEVSGPLNRPSSGPSFPDGLRDPKYLPSEWEGGETISDMGAIAEDLGRLSTEAEDNLERQARLISEIHDRLMHIRLVPFATLAARLRRTVRQVADSSRKRLDLTLEGEAVELDKAVLEEMAEPLMHLLRNAVDHGIEPSDRRRRRGKPDVGRISVRAAHEGNQIVLRVVDDGGGVDLEAVRTRAVERGLASSEAAARLTEAELLALPFQPGFSTAREISETSGRGVGLDVVRTCVERLNGSVSLTSRPGEGATFLVRLPMTVAIMRALLVKAHGQTFALPLASVVRAVRLGAQEAEEMDGQIRIGEERYPRMVLGETLRLPKSPLTDGERPSVLLVETGDGRAAVVVDQVQGGQEIVVKNLGTHLRNVRGVSGATLTGDGGVVLILNPAQLAAPSAALAASRQTDSAPAVARALSVLVVDDSPSVRRVLTGLIQGAGWTARTAGDGLEALDLLSAGPAPDVMLVDVDMPRMDGFEFLSAVKSREVHRGVPVVMVTSRSGASYRRKARDLGADGYFVKPYQYEELLTTIRRLTDMN